MSNAEAFKNGDPGCKLPQVYIRDVNIGEAYSYNKQTHGGLYRPYYTMIVVTNRIMGKSSEGPHYGFITAIDTQTKEEIDIGTDNLGYLRIAPIVIKLEDEEVPLMFDTKGGVEIDSEQDDGQ